MPGGRVDELGGGGGGLCKRSLKEKYIFLYVKLRRQG